MNISLRQSAEERLAKGTAPFTRAAPTGKQALTLLHDLASSPETASDALKLLHELQVHQVELDLQHEQAELDRQRLDEDLRDYTALFDSAPFAYMALDHDGLVIAANRGATERFASNAGEGKELEGRRLESLLAPECRSVVRNMLAGLRVGEGPHSCVVQLGDGGGSAHAVASSAPGKQVLIAFMPLVAKPGI